MSVQALGSQHRHIIRLAAGPHSILLAVKPAQLLTAGKSSENTFPSQGSGWGGTDVVAGWHCIFSLGKS